MARLLSTLAARAGRTAQRAQYSRVYVFLVISLAIFLVGLAVWRQPISGYTARAVIVRRGEPTLLGRPESDELRPGNCRDGVLSRKLWEALRKTPGLEADDAELAQARERTVVHAHEKPYGETHLVLWHMGDDAGRAVAVAQRLAELYVAEQSQIRQSQLRCQECDAAERAVRELAAAMAQADEALAAFRRQHARELSPAPASDRPAGAPVAAPNPLWRELCDQLDVLRAAHAQLLQQRTPAHPEVIDVAQQIEQAQRRLAATPRTLDAPPADAAASAAARPPAELVAQLEKLTAAADVAAQRHAAALAAERRAWQQRWSQPSEQIVIAESAHIAQRHGGGPSKGGVLLVALVAAAAGAAAAWRSQLVARPAALVSVQQVAALDLPVVAQLATRDGPAIPQPQLSNPPWVRGLTIGCELALVALLALVAVVALADWQLAAQAIRDPLTAFSDAIAQLIP